MDNDARKGTAPIPRPPPPPPGPIGIVDFEFSMSTKSRGLNGKFEREIYKESLALGSARRAWPKTLEGV